MADAYTATVYQTASDAQTAINAATADKLISVSTFLEGGKTKFLVVVAA